MSREKKSSFIRPLTIYLQYILFRLLAFLINCLNDKTAVWLSKPVGLLLSKRGRRRQLALKNLEKAFPEKTSGELIQIAESSFQSMVKVIFEFIRIPRIAKNPEKYIEIVGIENVWRALEKGKGVILAVSHFGNWELMAISATAKGLPLHAIGKPQKNPLLYEYIKKLRGATGLKSIDQSGAVKRTMQLLKQNQVIAMLIDEHVKKGAVWINFFGREAATSGLPAMLSIKYDAPVIPTFYYRNENGRALHTFGSPFEMIRTGNLHDDLIANTQQYVTCLENELRKRPGDWTLWMHNRWRSDDRNAETS